MAATLRPAPLELILTAELASALLFFAAPKTLLLLAAPVLPCPRDPLTILNDIAHLKFG